MRSRHLRDQAPSFAPIITTPPQTRKRKAVETLEDSSRAQKQSKTGDIATRTPADTALNTPPLTTMDSEDEFMSGLSSQDEDFGAMQESDDGSLGDGKSDSIRRTCRLNVDEADV